MPGVSGLTTRRVLAQHIHHSDWSERDTLVCAHLVEDIPGVFIACVNKTCAVGACQAQGGQAGQLVVMKWTRPCAERLQ